MQLAPTRLRDVVVLEPAVFQDERGWFCETFNERAFQEGLTGLGLPSPTRFVQDNHSCSAAGVMRGLHLQVAPHAQGKLVRVVRGRAFDVAVDVRPGSATWGQWVGVELSAANHRQLWVPQGFAHGLLSLEDDTHVLYKTTDFWAREAERSVLWSDPDIGIEWPLAALPAKPKVNAKDANAPRLKDLLL